VKKKTPKLPVDDYGKDDPVDPKVWELYRWGVFKTEAGKFVNIYFAEMVYPSLVKGGFLTKEEAEKCL
jgi:hypothetical protein